MSEFKLQDGAGTGKLAHITAENQLSTTAVTVTALQHDTREGKMWNMESGFITLTSANASDLLYFKNTGVKDVAVGLYVVITGASTGGSGDAVIGILMDPKADLSGNLISGAIKANPINMRVGNTAPPSGDYFIGEEGDALSGHYNTLGSSTTASSRLLLSTFTSLPQGQAVAMRITPPAGNTSMTCNMIMEFYEEDDH